MLISTKQTKANRPRLPEAVSITSLTTSGTAKAGDTFNIVVQYSAVETGNCLMTFSFPNSVAPLNKAANETERTDTVSMIKDSVYTRVYQVKAYAAGYSNITVSLLHLSPPSNHKAFTSKFLQIEHLSGTYRVISEENKVVDTLHVADINVRNEKKGNSLLSTVSSHISISGKVEYEETFKDQLGFKNVRQRGVSGVYVRLFFMKGNDPGLFETWYFCGGNEGVVKCSEDGSFNFELDCFDDNYHYQNFDRIMIYVEKQNDATDLKEGLATSYIIKRPNGTTLARTFLGEMLQLSFNPNQNKTLNNQKIEIEVKQGTALRFLQLSKDFADLKFSQYNIPFKKTYCIISDTLSYAGFFSAGQLYSPPYELDTILVHDTYSDATTLAHEYGHFVNFTVWNRVFGDYGITEGWARFYSMAVRNYCTHRYADHLLEGDDDMEQCPFVTPKFSKDITYNPCVGCSPAARDFLNRHIGAGSFLWGLYDGYNESNDIASLYKVGDNDDIDEYGDRIFAIMQHSPIDNIIAFKNKFNEGISSNNFYLAPLPDTLENFVNNLSDYCNILTFAGNPTTSNTSPAQIKSLVASKDANCNITLSWQPRTYVQNKNYGNYETGHRIWVYDGVNNKWIELPPTGAGVYSYTVNCSGLPQSNGVGEPCYKFKVSSSTNIGLNDLAKGRGWSYKSPTVRIGNCPSPPPPPNNLSVTTTK